MSESGEKIWNGIVRQLQDGEVDICAASLTMTHERSEAIDYTVGLIEDVFSLLFVNQAGSSREIDLMVFLTVFSKAAWATILAVATFSAVAYMIFSNWTKLGNVLAYHYAKHFIVGLYLFFLSLIQRNSDTGVGMQYAGQKLLLLTISLVSFVLFSLYGGDLTATMTAGVKAPSLRSFQDVINEDYEVYTGDGSALYDFFRTSKPGTTAHYIFEHRLTDSRFDVFLEEQLERPTKAVFFHSIFVLITYKDFLFLKHFDDAVTTQLAFGLQKDSEFRNLFNFHLNKLKQTGVLKLLVHKWLEEEKPADWSHRIFQDDAMSLGYENLFFPAMIMLIGISAGMFVLGVEKFMLAQKVIRY